ncbi:heterokaryon incompatibility protein-domain-containing protein, partial [Leptodontidium sp. 2 PMI_412]
LEECLHQHEHCPSPLNSSGQFDPPSLPVRVLDCGPPNGNPEDKVKLLISNGKRDTYVALSYCWGRTLQLRTLKNNIDSHVKDGIQIDKLPKTIQDAIHVTRNLKIRYLWIDSLCIIQDSLDDDWPREAAKMPEIYKNAFATISAASANDCAQGFLEDREAIKEEPINTRAWTLQESWLAPRLVVYGSGLFFTSGNEKNQHNSLSSPNPINRELSDDEYYLLREWYSLFTGYTQRSLTKQSDKFPAVSGIAKEFHRLLGDEYVAGLWSRTLPHSLLWRHDERENEAEPSVNRKSAEATRSLVSSSENLGTNWPSSTRDANVYVAPSWSPMQNNGPVVPEYPNERPGHT